MLIGRAHDDNIGGSLGKIKVDIWTHFKCNGSKSLAAMKTLVDKRK